MIVRSTMVARFSPRTEHRASHPFQVVPLDQVFRERCVTGPAQAWLRWYRHPSAVTRSRRSNSGWRNGVDYLRSFPSTVFDGESDDLFGRAIDDWAIGWITRFGWMWTQARRAVLRVGRC